MHRLERQPTSSEALAKGTGEPLDFFFEISRSFMLMVPMVSFLSYPGALDVD